MLEITCQDCDLDVVSVEEGLQVLQIRDDHWTFNIPLTAAMVALLIDALLPFSLAA